MEKFHRSFGGTPRPNDYIAEMNSSTVPVSGRAIFFEKYESKTGPPSPISGVIITKIFEAQSTILNAGVFSPDVSA